MIKVIVFFKETEFYVERYLDYRIWSSSSSLVSFFLYHLFVLSEENEESALLFRSQHGIKGEENPGRPDNGGDRCISHLPPSVK